MDALAIYNTMLLLLSLYYGGGKARIAAAIKDGYLERSTDVPGAVRLTDAGLERYITARAVSLDCRN